MLMHSLAGHSQRVQEAFPALMPAHVPLETCQPLTHHQAFVLWIRLPLIDQRDGLIDYLDELDPSERERSEQLDHYSGCVPASALEPERRLFFCCLDVILAGIRADRILSVGRKPSAWRVRQVLNLAFKERGNVGIVLKRVCVGVQISEGHLAALFKDAVGLGFRQYLRRLRVVSAAAMLAAESDSVGGIAAALGHAHCCNFVREFRLTIGITPQQFRALRVNDPGERFGAATRSAAKGSTY
jgi:AraC-like DNA-binding protein